MAEPVTVVVPAWNGERWLPGLFASLAAQMQPPAEVIVVDNGPSDETLEWLAREAPDARVLAQGRNTGFAVAANRGLLAARTELVALVNTDVVLAPNWIEVVAGGGGGGAPAGLAPAPAGGRGGARGSGAPR